MPLTGSLAGPAPGMSAARWPRDEQASITTEAIAEAEVHRAHHRRAARPGRLADAHEGDRDQRADDARGADRERVEEHRLGAREEDVGDQHRGGGGHAVGLEQVGRHARAVADVVADVVGDHGGVARIVLGDVRLDLATRSAPTSAPLVKMPPPRRANTEISEPPKARPISASGLVVAGGVHRPHERREREQAGAHHEQARHRAAVGRRAPKAGPKPVVRRLGDAHVGAHRDVHADEARQRARERADREAERVPAAEREAEQRRRSARRPSPRCGTGGSGRPRRRCGSRPRSRWRARSRWAPRARVR